MKVATDNFVKKYKMCFYRYVTKNYIQLQKNCTYFTFSKLGEIYIIFATVISYDPTIFFMFLLIHTKPNCHTNGIRK